MRKNNNKQTIIEYGSSASQSWSLSRYICDNLEEIKMSDERKFTEDEILLNMNSQYALIDISKFLHYSWNIFLKLEYWYIDWDNYTIVRSRFCPDNPGTSYSDFSDENVPKLLEGIFYISDSTRFFNTMGNFIRRVKNLLNDMIKWM